MATKRKFVTSIVAGVTAAALLLGGTFAWTSISQQAKNEAIVDINPGGRLHDDFNGTNKDVYVENFGDNETGVPIYARIRLDQYFEVGQDAGINKDGEDRKVDVLTEGADINNVKTWITYLPGETIENAAEVAANGNWSWKLGRTVEADGSLPYYMPTFNKNKDSLKADINGTYEGTDEGDIVHYDDYTPYAEGSTATKTEVYDHDSNTDEEDENDTALTIPYSTDDPNAPIDAAHVLLKESVEHTAEQISSGSTVMTMAQWIANGSQPGPYWVYDTDGWAYWAQAIAPGTTTGLLLDSISLSRVPDDNYYYAINVVGQFATAGDLSAFNTGDETMTPNAELLFGKITNTEQIVIDGPATVNIGESVTFKATRMALGGTVDGTFAFDWTATDAAGQAIDGVTMNSTTGELTIADTVAHGTQITVTATVPAVSGNGDNANEGISTASAEGEETPVETTEAPSEDEETTPPAESDETTAPSGESNDSSEDTTEPTETEPTETEPTETEPTETEPTETEPTETEPTETEPTETEPTETEPTETEPTETEAPSETETPSEGEETPAKPLSASVTVTALGNVKITAAGNLAKYSSGKETSETFAATIKGVSADTGTVTWAVADGEGSTLTETTFDDSTSTLTIGAAETAGKIVLTATYKSDDGQLEFTDTYEILRDYEISTTDDMSATAYAILTDDGSGSGTYTMTFVRSHGAIEDGLSTYNKATIAKAFTGFEDLETPTFGWTQADYRDTITTIRTENTVKPATLKRAFSSMKKLRSFDFSKMETDAVTSMYYMFAFCSSLTEAVLPENFGCNAETLEYAFGNCNALTSVKMSGTYNNLTSLKCLCSDSSSVSADLSDMVIPAENMVDVSYMFKNCMSAGDILVPKNLTISKIDNMFSEALFLKSVSGMETWDVSQVASFSSVFEHCQNVKVDLRDWVVTNATNCSNFNDEAPGVIAPTWPEGCYGA